MKKLVIVLLILVLCIAGWAGATYVVAGKMESRYFSLLDQYGHWGPLTLSNQSYQRGFLSSKAATVLELKVPKRPRPAQKNTAVESIQLVFEHTFRNGPRMFNVGPDGQSSLAPGLALVETRLVSISPGQEDFEKLLAQVPELQRSFGFTRVGLDGALTSQLLIPPFESLIEGDSLSWGGLRFKSEFAPGEKSLRGNFEMPKIAFQNADSRMNWDGISGRFDLNEVMPQLYVGTSEVAFGAMKMNVPDQKSGQPKDVLLKGFEIATDSSCEDQLVQYNQTMKFAGVTVDGETFGPGDCEIEMKNLDAEVLSDFQSRVREVYREVADFSPEEMMARMLPVYTQLLVKLIEGDPELNIQRLHFATPLGDVDGKVLVKFAGHQGLTVEDPQALLQYLQAEADVSIQESLVSALVAESVKAKLQVAREQGSIPQLSDEELASLAEQQANTQLDALLAQNFIVREGENIKSQASFNQGKLILNGRSLPITQPR